MRIVFSEIADQSYEKILEFLSKVWTEKEVEIFINDTESIVDELKVSNYLMFQKSRFKTRSALIGKKHVRMFFIKEHENLIKVLLFFDMREDPKKIPNLLKSY